MKDPAIVQAAIDRPNLFIEVRRTVNRAMKEQALLELLRGGAGSGIVYCATVKKVEELHRWLRARARTVTRYHGKLRPRSARRMQAASCPATRAW